MNAMVIQAAGRRVAGWGAITLFVVFFSFIFSFLGTITCAALLGMMLGAIKYSKSFSASVSLVFPAVIFGLFRTAKVELSQQQVILVAGLCFGTFWVTYLVSAVVIFCEQKGKPASGPSAPGRGAGPLAQPGQDTASEDASGAVLPTAPVPASESCLEQLQGEWVCEASNAGGPSPKRVIQIKQAKLELRAIDASGRTTLLARGDVLLQALRASPPLTALEGPSESADAMVSI